VLGANVLGGLAIAAFVALGTLLPPASIEAMHRIGEEALAPGVFVRAIFAGWLIALIVWLLPFAESGRLWVVFVVTYSIGLGHMSHVVAGSIQVFAIAFSGDISWWTAISRFFVPALLGNILGGLILVAAINHAQVTAGGEDGA